ncbi:MAG: hypothetical protein CMI54_02075 [Parcubacteria group bacterium]|jgi:hypothetical protein|nr:hypothetical protein [Parcubacteria group bacterium]|tara:strand:- start:4086 stop:4787 length:702 start_codon:yes stop_codon:yes gene_type:complete
MKKQHRFIFVGFCVIVLGLLILSGCRSPKKVIKDAVEEAGEGLNLPDKPDEPGKDDAAKITPVELMEGTFKDFKWVWRLCLLLGILIAAGSLHPALSKLGFLKVGGGLSILAILGPLVVYVLMTVVSVLMKLFIGLAIAAFIGCVLLALWYGYHKLKKQKGEHEVECAHIFNSHIDQVKELERQRDKVIHINQHTKNDNWSTDGKKTAAKMLSDDKILKDVIDDVKAKIDTVE